MSVLRSKFRLLCAGMLVSAAMLSGQAKVAIINTQKALLDTSELKKAQAEMEAKFKPRQEQMEKLQKEIAGIQQQLQTMAGKLTPQAEQEMSVSGQRKQKDLQRLGEDLQADVDRERADILGRAGQRMQAVVQKLAEEKGLDVIIDVSNAVYFKPALDISKEATDAYDKAHPAK